MRTHDVTEAWINAIVGLGISTAIVFLLRRVGLWDAPAAALSAVFFIASVARSYVIRRIFRMVA